MNFWYTSHCHSSCSQLKGFFSITRSDTCFSELRPNLTNPKLTHCGNLVLIYCLLLIQQMYSILSPTTYWRLKLPQCPIKGFENQLIRVNECPLLKLISSTLQFLSSTTQNHGEQSTCSLQNARYKVPHKIKLWVQPCYFVYYDLFLPWNTYPKEHMEMQRDCLKNEIIFFFKGWNNTLTIPVTTIWAKK